MLTRLNERMAELSVVIEGPVSHLLENNKRDMSDLHTRLDAMEQLLAAKQKSLAVAPASPVAAESHTTNSAGKWVVNLVSFPRPAVADLELVKLSRAGIQAEKYQVNSKKETWYRIRVTGFDSRQAAKSYADAEAHKAGYTQAWVSRF
jgi:cell division septation protein DedD